MFMLTESNKVNFLLSQYLITLMTQALSITNLNEIETKM